MPDTKRCPICVIFNAAWTPFGVGHLFFGHLFSAASTQEALTKIHQVSVRPYDAGFASALGKSVITLHDETLDHALKEVDAVALAVTRNVDQVVGIMEYVTKRPF